MNGAPITPYVLAGAGLVITVLGFFLARLLSQIDAGAKSQWRRIDKQTEQLAVLDKRLSVLEALTERAERNEGG